MNIGHPLQRAPASPAAVEPVATAAPAAQCLVDAAIVESLREIGGEVLIDQIVKAFIDCAQPAMTAMRSAVQAGDPAALASQAHSLKSAGANLGLVVFAARARSLEGLGKAGALQQASRELDALQADFEKGLAALASERGIAA